MHFLLFRYGHFKSSLKKIILPVKENNSLHTLLFAK